jgi:hypothetical protein
MEPADIDLRTAKKINEMELTMQGPVSGTLH